jgi:DNA-binding HxlR family transcriptional regulator
MSRSGGQALTLLSAPLNVHTLEALLEGPKELLELRSAAASPPPSTMRIYTRTMINLGVMRRRRRDGFPGGVEFELTSAGRALLDVGSVLRDWLQTSPDGSVSLGSAAAKSAIKALAESWRTNIIRLTTQPVSLTELDRAIPMISYPSLERRVTAMRRAHLVEQQPGGGRRTGYRATRWLHRAIVPIAAAIAWERRYVPDETPPVSRLDVETAFLLAVPLMKLPAAASGRCRLAVEVQAGTQPASVGVVICIEEGRVRSCSSRLEGEVEASPGCGGSAVTSTESWRWGVTCFWGG